MTYTSSLPLLKPVPKSFTLVLPSLGPAIGTILKRSKLSENVKVKSPAYSYPLTEISSLTGSALFHSGFVHRVWVGNAPSSCWDPNG